MSMIQWHLLFKTGSFDPNRDVLRSGHDAWKVDGTPILDHLAARYGFMEIAHRNGKEAREAVEEDSFIG